jgi:hypothetical protein
MQSVNFAAMLTIDSNALQAHFMPLIFAHRDESSYESKPGYEPLHCGNNGWINEGGVERRRQRGACLAREIYE